MLKDKIGTALGNFLLPYMQNNRSGLTMKKRLNYEDYCLKEKQLWFLGKEDLLRDFYKTNTENYIMYNPRTEYYYTQADNGIRIVHSGLPSLISYSKVRLLTTGDMDYKVIDEKEKEIEDKSEVLKEIFDDNNLTKIIKESILTESWAGKFAWKIMLDKEISDYPIVQLYSPLEYEVDKKCDRIQSITFKNTIVKDNEEFLLEEVYGKGQIVYLLYKITNTGKQPIPLDYLEETKDLEDVMFADKKIILAGVKESKSDYENIISEFDSLDETWSQLMDEIRLARSEVYIPETWLTNKTYNKFRKNYAVMAPDMHENTVQKTEHIQPDIRSEEYKNAIDVITANILVNVGLSPFTVGIDDGIGANASGESLEKREASSLRTRDEMIKTWEPFIEEMLVLLLKANDMFNNKTAGEYIVKVSFEDYITPNKNEIIAQTKALVDANIIDTEMALEEVYGDTLDDEVKTRILANTGNLTEPLDIEEENEDEEE